MFHDFTKKEDTDTFFFMALNESDMLARDIYIYSDVLIKRETRIYIDSSFWDNRTISPLQTFFFFFFFDLFVLDFRTHHWQPAESSDA